MDSREQNWLESVELEINRKQEKRRHVEYGRVLTSDDSPTQWITAIILFTAVSSNHQKLWSREEVAVYCNCM